MLCDHVAALSLALEPPWAQAPLTEGAPEVPSATALAGTHVLGYLGT